MKVEVYFTPYSTGGDSGTGYYTVFLDERPEEDRWGRMPEEHAVRMNERGLDRLGEFRWALSARDHTGNGHRIRLDDCPWRVRDAIEAVVAANYGPTARIEDLVAPEPA